MPYVCNVLIIHILGMDGYLLKISASVCMERFVDRMSIA